MDEEEYEKFKKISMENYGAAEAHLGTEAYQALVRNVEMQHQEHQEMANYYSAKASLNTALALFTSVVMFMTMIAFVPVIVWLFHTVFWGL